MADITTNEDAKQTLAPVLNEKGGCQAAREVAAQIIQVCTGIKPLMCKTATDVRVCSAL
jgi:hypothetical protein